MESESVHDLLATRLDLPFAAIARATGLSSQRVQAAAQERHLTRTNPQLVRRRIINAVINCDTWLLADQRCEWVPAIAAAVGLPVETVAGTLDPFQPASDEIAVAAEMVRDPDGRDVDIAPRVGVSVSFARSIRRRHPRLRREGHDPAALDAATVLLADPSVPYREISRRTGLSFETVMTLARKTDAPRRPRGGPIRLTSDLLASMAAAGATVDEIAQAAGVKPSTVRTRARRDGITVAR